MFWLKVEDKNGKTLIEIGKEPEPPMSDEEVVKFVEGICRENEADIAADAPSSEEGKNLYIGRKGVFGFPIYVVQGFICWLHGRRAWYSKNGLRIERD